jgi:ATP-dependent Lon protease
MTRTARQLPVLPLKNTVVFPQVVVPLAVGRPRSLQLLEDLPHGERTLAVSAQLDESIEEATR